MTRELRWLKEYVAKQDSIGFPEQHRQMLAAYAVGLEGMGPRSASFGGAVTALNYLAGYRSVLGSLAVIDGDQLGFKAIDDACLYRYWAIRLLARAYDADTRPDKRPRVYMEALAAVWMHAAALGAAEPKEWLSKRILQVYADDQSVGGKGMNPLCTLVAHYVTGDDAFTLKHSGWGEIDAYAPVVNRTFCCESYDELADYHTRRVDGAGYPEFHFYPYRVLPSEIFAIENLSGVALKQPTHPLLTSPLAVRREVAEIAATDELKGVLERASSEFPL